MRQMKTANSALIAVVSCVTFGMALPAVAQTVRVPGATSSRIGVATRDVYAADVSRDKLPGEFGAYVTDVSPGGPADKAAIRTGDVIIEFDGVRVRSAAELQRLVRETPPQRAVKVGAVREGRRVDLTVTTDADARAMNEFQFRVPEFREGPLQPPYSYRLFPEFPPTGRPPMDVSPFVHPGPSPLRPNAPRLGIGVQDLTPQLADYFRTKEGVLVSSVEDGSPASKAGVKAGDIITSVDGRAVAHREDVPGAVRGKRAGDEVTLGVVRDGKPLTIRIKL